MPEHNTWFNYLGPHFYEFLARARELLGLSYIGHAPIEVQYVIGFLLVAAMILALLFVARRRITDVERALVPEGRLTPSSFFEAMVEGSINLMEQIMDREAARTFLPLIGTSAFVILFSNLIGLVPGFLPPTSNLNTTLAMAIVIFFVTHIYGMKAHGLGYFAHWFGPIRKWYALPLMLLIFVIEVVSHLVRPVSLSIRLMGNMFADHKVVTIFTGLVPLLLPVPMMLLGVLVCIVQTAVFCILSTAYIGLAVAPQEEH
ncbi:MAG: F0F1 ATP synthase subunit A [Myxococcota bacterium]|jgi:F-type H+-transporting ATPase subunit a|nr:F0F1 ATP synthase subunit A [Myxococcota bacterium]